MHDVPRDFLHQLLECDLGELTRKDILNQVRVAFSDFVSCAQYWHRYLRATMCESLWVAVDCGGHVVMVKMTPTRRDLLHFKSILLCMGIHCRESSL